jgi:hypothetical protein
MTADLDSRWIEKEIASIGQFACQIKNLGLNRWPQAMNAMFRSSLACVLLCISAGAQQKTPPAKPSLLPIPVFDIKMSPNPDLSITLPDSMFAFSDQCDSDGNPYVWTMGSSGRVILGFTPKGVITFATDQMSDIPEPRVENFFVGTSGLYALVAGIERARKEEVIDRDEQGREWRRIETKGEPRYYIARFDRDGSYRGSLKLDFKFHPIQLAAFDSGSFVMAGTDETERHGSAY